MEKMKELREKQEKLVADARAKMEEIKDDTPETRAKEIETEYDAMMVAYDNLDGEVKALEARETKRQQIEDREAELEAARNRPDPRRPTGNDIILPHEEDAKVTTARKAAFDCYLRYGTSGLSAEQRKLLVQAPVEGRAQGTQVGTQGGYFVPDTFMNEVMVSLAAWGPMLNPGVTRMLRTATGAAMPWPTLDDTANEGSQIGENVQVTELEVVAGTKNIEAYKYSSRLILVPSELLQDSVVNVEELIRNAMGERLGRIGNRHLSSGDGASKPHGIATAASAGYTAASATAIVIDDLMELEHSVDPAYRTQGTCRFMFHDSTLKALRKLKDGEGRYLWQPADVRAGAPTTILNYPYSINQAMAAIGTGNRSVVFGDFSRYITRVVNEFAVRRLIERYADYDQVGFIGFMRMDGELMDTGAVKRLTHP